MFPVKPFYPSRDATPLRGYFPANIKGYDFQHAAYFKLRQARGGAGKRGVWIDEFNQTGGE